MFVRHTAFAVAVCFLILLLSSALSATPRTVLAKVERVSDGDTITAVTSNQTKLRLDSSALTLRRFPTVKSQASPLVRRPAIIWTT